MLFTGGLIVSIVGLVSLIYVKYWELTTGKVVAVSVRPRVDRASKHTLVLFEQILPTLLRIYSRRIWLRLLAFVHRISAWIVLKTEQVLERTLHGLRRSTDVKRVPGEASVFLRQVAEHKKKLLSAQRSQSYLHKE